MFRKSLFIIAAIVCLLGNSCSHRANVPLPEVHLTIDSLQRDSLYSSRENKIYTQAVIFSSERDTLYDHLAEIHTRGNGTYFWSGGKYSFSLELEYGTALFNLPRTKDFVLISNSHDESYIRTVIAFELAHRIGISAPEFAYVKLYFNEEYMGLYLMTNQIKVGRQNVDIADLNQTNKVLNRPPLSDYPQYIQKKSNETGYRKGWLLTNEPVDISGGYLLEYRRVSWVFERSKSGFVSDGGSSICVRAPKYASRNEINYIADYYNQMEFALMSHDGINTKNGKHYSEYLDIPSFAKYYILQELLLNIDAGSHSTYMYKDSGDEAKFYAGPIWDFDSALKSATTGRFFDSTQEIFAAAPIGEQEELYNKGLFYYLCQHEDFMLEVQRTYREEIYPEVTVLLSGAFKDSLRNLLFEEAEQDRLRNPGITICDSYKDAFEIPFSFLSERSRFLYWLWCEANKDEIIDISIVGLNDLLKRHYERDVHLYGKASEGVLLPMVNQPSLSKDSTSILGWFSLDDDCFIPEDTKLHKSQTVTLRIVK